MPAGHVDDAEGGNVNNAEKIETVKELIRKILPSVDASVAISLTTALSLLDEVA